MSRRFDYRSEPSVCKVLEIPMVISDDGLLSPKDSVASRVTELHYGYLEMLTELRQRREQIIEAIEVLRADLPVVGVNVAAGLPDHRWRRFPPHAGVEIAW
jgi:hypothetical protein